MVTNNVHSNYTFWYPIFSNNKYIFMSNYLSLRDLLVIKIAACLYFNVLDIAEMC